MRIASLIYLVSALAYAGWDVQLSLSGGAHLGSLIMVIFVAAFLAIAYSLFRNKPHARISAMICSLALALCFGYMALSLVLPPDAMRFSEKMEIVGPFFFSAIAVAIAHAFALAVLLFRPPVHPNYSLKRTAADGLR